MRLEIRECLDVPFHFFLDISEVVTASPQNIGSVGLIERSLMLITRDLIVGIRKALRALSGSLSMTSLSPDLVVHVAMARSRLRFQPEATTIQYRFVWPRFAVPLEDAKRIAQFVVDSHLPSLAMQLSI